MAPIHIQRIKSALKKLFDSRIDMSDYQNKPKEEKEKAFLSRALASYALMLLCSVDEDVAGAALTDGFDDGGRAQPRHPAEDHGFPAGSITTKFAPFAATASGSRNLPPAPAASLRCLVTRKTDNF